jgi:hypothetical protein
VKKFTVRKTIFCVGLTRAAKAGQKSLVPARQAQRNNQVRTPFHFVLFESPFASVSTVSKGHPSLVSLVFTWSRRDFFYPSVRAVQGWFYLAAKARKRLAVGDSLQVAKLQLLKPAVSRVTFCIIYRL